MYRSARHKPAHYVVFSSLLLILTSLRNEVMIDRPYSMRRAKKKLLSRGKNGRQTHRNPAYVVI